MDFILLISAAVIAQQTLDWFDKVSNFGVLAVMMLFFCWGIVVVGRYLAHKLFADADQSKNFRGGLVTRWVDGQLCMMEEIREAVKKGVETQESFAHQMEKVMDTIAEVKQHVVVETDSVTLIPKGKQSRKAPKTHFDKEGADDDLDSGR